MSEMHLILPYLTDLAQHNDRAWYADHKAERLAATDAFETVVQKCIEGVGVFEPSVLGHTAKELTFRLTRDTRFSKDKSPYNPAFRAHIGPKGKLPVPVGYYLFIQPGDRSFLGGGLFADMFSSATAMVRDALQNDPEAFERIVSAPAFAERFVVCGTKLKNVPRGMDKDHPLVEYLKHKSWYLEVPVSDKALLQEDFVENAVDTFGKMAPFNAFLNQALEGFEMPSRG